LTVDGAMCVAGGGGRRGSCIAQDAGLDNATKRDLQTVIQAHFKEWLVASGNMRQVYDLARMERGEGA
jgi:hypothetical protein